MGGQQTSELGNGVSQMLDQTGKHTYHIFEANELLSSYSIKDLNRLVHGPNIHALNWTPAVTNVRTGTSTTVRHHCSQGSDGWYRCGLQQMVMSTGCKKHRDDEMRKVFDKIRKGYPVYGWELNRPGSGESNQCSESKMKAIVEASKAEQEEVEKQLEECGKVDESVFVYARMKKMEEERAKERKWQRKNEKERARLGK
ncbi:hypothetical protein COCMIDRAFT_104063 [Bipolaris oryzae ATCC 44560]|uniref:Uncharacterized protein n=1 Tax=Bipolaris oryzae ATCC 44560 TaxID=930090 RepID=W6YS26_COCMI|nr:uncharacterized protein COCMIDRAFT_104063 [Bipolaris oryzae ATCC 44560]EUC42247.1 hypothetical protein COCMIDRAFT_104063 [Bipolaris oryzae ATCC 44560]